MTKTLNSKAIKKPPKRMRFGGLEASPGFEPGIKVLQTDALPLGYDALLDTTTDTKIVSVVVGAEDEIRTRDVHLGKVTLYH